jgi:hypothetical protein
MARLLSIDAAWDDEANVWLATSADVPGLVVEAETWPSLVHEIELVLPDLLELAAGDDDEIAFTVRAESGPVAVRA